jgi:hypothetical protein
MALSDLHPELEHDGPLCLWCNSSTALYHVGPRNRNGNAGRPYYKCSNATCREFATFADLRGIHNSIVFGQNFVCSCPSYNLPRLQVAGRESKHPHALHWVCATGKCDMFAWCGNDGIACVLDPDQIDLFISAGIL